MMLPIKTIMSMLKVSTYIFTGITVWPIGTHCDTSDNVGLNCPIGYPIPTDTIVTSPVVLQ
jgi:hypothetical protein